MHIFSYIFRSVLIFIAVSTAFVSCVSEDMSDCQPKNLNMKLVYTLALDEHSMFSPEREAALQSIHNGFWTTPDSLFEENYYVQSQLPVGLIFDYSLPRRNYLHLATANCFFNDAASEPNFSDDIHRYSIVPRTIAPDTIEAFLRPMYFGLYDIPADSCTCKEVEYVVPLSPLVSRMIISLIYPETFTNVRATIIGTKAGFVPYDTTYISNDQLVTAVDSSLFVPNADTISTASFFTFPTSVAEVNASSSAAMFNIARQEVKCAVWYISFFANKDEKVVMNRFTLYDEVFAGDVFERTFRLVTDTTQVESGVEVDLDWKCGDNFDEII